MPTANRGFATPATGSLIDLWGEDALNPNFELIDSALGAVASVALASSPVTLSAAEYACGTIRFSGILTANVTVTFPSVSAWWTIDNRTTGNFYVLLTCGAGENIAVPQTEATQIFTDGTNTRFAALPSIGVYWDYAGAAVPNWVAACTVPPFLLCDGTTFNAVTYPRLNTILGGTTLPDFRGRSRFYLDGGTSRITTAGSGIDGATRFAVGGAQNVSILQANIPSYNLSASLSVTGNATPDATVSSYVNSLSPAAGSEAAVVRTGGATTVTFSVSGTASGNVSSGGSGTALNKMPPTCIGGVTMIRAG